MKLKNLVLNGTQGESFYQVCTKKKREMEETVFTYSACWICGESDSFVSTPNTENAFFITICKKQVVSIELFTSAEGNPIPVLTNGSPIKGCFMAIWFGKDPNGPTRMHGMWISNKDGRNDLVQFTGTFIEKSGKMKDILNCYHEMFRERVTDELRTRVPATITDDYKLSEQESLRNTDKENSVVQTK